MSGRMLVALAGQPNSGKSTIFNMLTGARQHVANYPGVTVDKKTGFFSADGQSVELVDLPGTYSLTSYSLEERVARDFILRDKPEAIINVADASNLKRNLYLTLQLLEMEIPLIMALNMMDVAARRSISIDREGLSKHLGIPVIAAVGKKGTGAAEIKAAVAHLHGAAGDVFRLDYHTLEPSLQILMDEIGTEKHLAGVPLRWMAVKLMENDEAARTMAATPRLLEKAEELRRKFEEENGLSADRHIAFSRHRAAASMTAQFVTMPKERRATLSDRADRFVCHKFFGPVILVIILLVLYQISIVYGGQLAGWVWPFWEKISLLGAGLLPPADFLREPMIRSLGIWIMKSLMAVLNYLPIFFLLFSLIAVLEDSGYMPRMAFILDRAFRRFGLHGQSTLPLILGGVYVGGCAIPAVMATKAIPDEKARLATILIAPMMNCLAKVPLYLILISAYFAEHSGMAMFFIATVTLFMALPVAKALSLTLLRGKPSAPFIMEMPPYHLPTLHGVLRRAIERVWLFVKKIVTVVLAVAVVIFALISFPGLGQERMALYEERGEAAKNEFMTKLAKTSLAGQINKEDLAALIRFEEDLKDAKKSAADQQAAARIDERFSQENPVFFAIIRGSGDDGKILRPAMRKLISSRKQLLREIREETFENSFLGMAGRSLVPVTKYAGFDWKINIALLSAFAAKENSAATLGAIYGIDGDTASVQESMKAGALNFGPLHALALMLFMALYPPCVPTSIMVRLESNSTKWMFFSIFYQTFLGLAVAVLVFSGGSALGLTGWQAMWAFYGLCVTATLVMGALPDKRVERSAHIVTPLSA